MRSGRIPVCAAGAMRPASSKADTRPVWLVVDSDAGVDDAFALCMALNLAGPQTSLCDLGGLWAPPPPSRRPLLKLITTTFGNTSLAKVNVNVAKVRRACGRSAATGPRICPGADRSLLATPPIDAEGFHGTDGFGDAPVDVIPPIEVPARADFPEPLKTPKTLKI